MKKTISLCMIVKNEEKYLEKCLSSVKDVVDEIIIVDTGSTDRTKEIAKKYESQIYDLEWKNDFSFARNFSLEKATSEYILVLDADEYLDESSNLQKVLESERDHYTIRIKNLLTSGGSIYHPAVRLFKNIRGLFYFGSIHEHLNVEDKSLNLTHEFGDLIINHVGYKEEIVQEKNKHERNLKLLLEEVKMKPNGYNYYNLGNQYKSNHEYENALNAYQIAFPLSKDRLYIQYLLYNMIDCLRQLERYEEALNVCDASIESFPNHTDFHFMRGRLFEEINYYRDAEIAYKECLNLGEVELFQTLEGVGSFLACVRLGSIYMKQGYHIKAFDMAIEALKFNKYHMPALLLYLESVRKTRISVEQIKEHLSHIYPVQNLEDLRTLIIVLAVSKSPLLKEYIDEFRLKVDDTVLAVSNLYSKEYYSAFDMYSSLEKIEESEIKDVLLLSYLLKMDNLISDYRSMVNLNDKEWKKLIKLITRQDFEFVQMGKELEEIIFFLLEQLIYLNETEAFNFIVNTLKGTNCKVKLAKLLLENGLYDGAQKILLDEFNNNQNNSEVIEPLADTCFMKRQYIEALAFYNRAIIVNSRYELFEKTFYVYEALNDKEGIKMIKTKIRQLYPLCMWVF